MAEVSYNDPQFRVVRTQYTRNAAAGTVAHYRPLNPEKIVGARFTITTAGTNDACTAILRGGAAGTTAIGTATLGTQTAGSVVSLSGLDSAVAANDLVNVLTNHSVSVDVQLAVKGDPGPAQNFIA